MHPFHVEHLAAERRDRLLRDAEHVRLVRSVKLASTARLRIRPLEASDHRRLTELYDALSPLSRLMRRRSSIELMPTLVLEQLSSIDHDQHEALGAFDRRGLVASAHWFRPHRDPTRAEVVMQVVDRYQRRGVGTRLLHALGQRAQHHEIDRFGTTFPVENAGALGLMYATGWPLATRSFGPQLSIIATLNPGRR
jgi:GNAT superfamily N-acetyltransferase